MNFNFFLFIALINCSFCANAQTESNTRFQVDISEIDSKNFTCLKKYLENKRIVLIGESSHGVFEFGEFKKETVKYLVDSLGFSTVFIESGLSDIYKWTSGDRNIYDSLVYSIFPIWHTSSYIEMFKFLKEKNIKVFGIDPQNSSKYFADFPYEQLCKINPEIAEKFYTVDKEWSRAYSKPILFWDSITYQVQKKAIIAYESVLDEIEKNILSFSVRKDYLFLKRILENRLSLAKAFNKSADYFHRDSIISKNVDWLLENVLATNDKVIILSHNSHVAKEKNMNVGYLSNLMCKQYDDKMFVIAQYFASGEFVDMSGKINNIPLPIKNSFEAYLGIFKNNYNLFDTHNLGLPKKIFNRKIISYYMGGPIIQELNLSKNYDLIFTVKHAKASNLIKLK